MESVSDVNHPVTQAMDFPQLLLEMAFHRIHTVNPRLGTDSDWEELLLRIQM